MDKETLQQIISDHQEWVFSDGASGKRADLSGVNLSGANLQGAYLSGVVLTGANLSGANLARADLSGVNLSEANLQGANFTGVDLSWADLSWANLTEANLSGADFRGANLSYTILKGADLRETNLSQAYLQNADLTGAKNIPFIPMICPEKGAFVGYKKAWSHIVELQILEDARRSSATSRKCRCDKAKVLSITNLDGTKSELLAVPSNHNADFIYRVGEIVEEPNFCTDRFKECAAGIHFFINREEAVKFYY